MKNRIIKIVSLFLAIVCLLSGCALGGTKLKTIMVYPEGKEAQAVIAFNPVFYLDGANVLAFNDVNAAITSDVNAKTLTALYDNSNWKWISHDNGVWKPRATSTLDSWRNRGNVSNGKFKAYAYNSDGTISLMCYAKNQLSIESYNNDVFPDMGLLMSTSGDKLESLSYVVSADGLLEIPNGTFTMVKSVGGVETGFLDNSDGSIRTAVVNIMVNNTVLWSGEFGNGVGENGETVTYLEYPAFSSLPVTSGDIISFAIQLNGQKATDIYNSEDEDADFDDVIFEDNDYDEDTDNTVDSNPQQDDTSEPEQDNASNPEEDNSSKPDKEVIKELSFVDGYDSRFEVVYPQNASIAVRKIANNFYTKLETVTETSVRLKTDNTDDHPASEYEILIGETNRSASKEIYSQLRGYRKNYANDYIVAVKGNNVVIAGGSEMALENAYDFFVTTYLLDDNSKVPTNMYHVSRPKVKSILIGGVDVSKFVIRTEKYPSILTKRAANDLKDYFIAECGFVVPVENDQKTTKNEILVGLTERSGISAKVFKNQSLDYISGYDAEQYNIFFKNGKLFIEAGSDYAANFASGLVLEELKTKNSVSKTFSKKGVYSTSDTEKYTLSDGYGFTWSDEFLTSTKDGTPIDNELIYWIDDAPAGDDATTYVAHKTTSKLVEELLKLDTTDPLRYLLGEKTKNNTYGDYYPFGKMSQPGFGKAYGVTNNMLYQKTKFDTKTGFWNSRLNTKKTMSFRYGIFEVRQIASAADAVCTALWFTGASGLADDCEIDLYENFGTQSLHPNLHTWANYHTNHTNHSGMGDFRATSGRLTNGQRFDDTFHYIGMEWSKDYIDFYLDGEIFCAVPMTEEKWYAFEQKIYPRIDMGVTGGFYLFDSSGYIGSNGGIEELLNFESTQYTDYVRIFQKNGERHRIWDYITD